MTDEEINERIAEWCEAKPTDSPYNWAFSLCGFWLWGSWSHKWYSRWKFVSSLDDCAKFEELVRERHWTDRYMDALAPNVTIPDRALRSNRLCFATPRQRCEALLKVIAAIEERTVNGDV
jgi:hypothetical protein